MKKKIAMMLAALISMVLVIGISGCGKLVDNSSPDTLSLLIKKNDADRIYVQRIIDLYEKQTGITIKVYEVEENDYDQEVLGRIQNGDIPDLFFHFNDTSLINYDVPENFYYMNEEEWVDELTDGAKAYCMDGEGNLLGLPFWESSVSGCYYNKKLLDELGLKPAATQTEFDALCQALKSIGYTPMYWAGKDSNWIFQFGLDPVFADNPEYIERLNKNEITYADIPEVVQMVEWLDTANKNGWFNSGFAEAEYDDITPAMKNGEAVFFFVWDTWFSAGFDEESKYSQDDFALMPVFMNTAENGTYEGGNLNMLMVSKNSPRLELALDFLSFCADAENYNAAFDGVFTVNCFKGQTTNIQSSMVTDAIVSVQANERPSTAWPRIIGYKQVDVGDAVFKMFKGETDVEGCIRMMDECRIAAAREAGAEGF